MIRLSLLLLGCLGLVWGAPAPDEGPRPASCTDPVVLGAANEAMDKINKDRTEGYVFQMKRLVNAHSQPHGENSVLFYLTMNVQETNCSVVSRRHFKNCEVRDLTQTPVYGQCKAAFFMSRVHRVMRLYNYNCAVRPMSGQKVLMMCPDCPVLVGLNNPEVQKTVTKAVEKFNKNSGLTKYFKLLEVTRASLSHIMGRDMRYHPEFSIQETTCANGVEKPEDCPLMDCEFAHKGFCRASHSHGMPDPSGDNADSVTVNCEIFEPQAAEQERQLHAQGADHSHDDTQVTDHSHDHSHAGHSHTHPHSHGHSHDHGHAHHHAHLHEHEHHHHHHHGAAQASPRKPEGMWRHLPELSDAVTLPAFPDLPAAPGLGVTLPLAEDPQIPGQMEPAVGPSPATLSAQCPPPPSDTVDDLDELMATDPEFRLPA